MSDTSILLLFLQAADFGDVFGLQKAVDEARELRHIGDFQCKASFQLVALIVFHVHVQNGDAFVCHDLRNVAQDVRTVKGKYRQINGIAAAFIVSPAYVDYPLGVDFAQMFDVLAVAAVNVDAAALGDEADDGASRHGLAAGGEVDHEVFHAVDFHIAAARFACGFERDARKAFVEAEVFLRLVRLLAGGDFMGDGEQVQIAEADAGK